MRRGPLRGRGRAGRALCLPLPRMPEAVGLGLRHLGHPAAGRLPRDAGAAEILVADDRERRAQQRRLLPGLRLAALARAQRCAGYGQHQGRIARRAAGSGPGDPYLDRVEAAGRRHSSGLYTVYRRAAGLRLSAAFRPSARGFRLLALHPLPERFQLLDRAFARSAARGGEQRLEPAEAPLELGVGAAERGLRLDPELPGEVDAGEEQIADLVLAAARATAPAAISARTSPSLLGDLVQRPARASGQSKPIRAARFCSLPARVSAGRPSGTPSSALGLALGLRTRRRSAAFCSSQARVCASAPSMTASANTCGWRRIILSDKARDDVVESRRAPASLGHLGMEHDLEQQVAELVLERGHVVALDRVGDLVGFLDGVRDDGAEALLEIPGAAALRGRGAAP